MVKRPSNALCSDVGEHQPHLQEYSWISPQGPFEKRGLAAMPTPTSRRRLFQAAARRALCGQPTKAALNTIHVDIVE
jgi:hypothetical protein